MELEPGYKQTETGVIPEDWEVKALHEITECMDNLRIPLNEAQRLKRQGVIPYCGANGVLDHIDDFIIDDDIILIAEDGGYFDEYLTRPIAYRMMGKCWVNNHAHILKAKAGVNQGFIYYSLVHKNILRYIASGTRAKLNRSELNKIEIPLPPTEAEQEAIAKIMNDVDVLIESLKQLIAKKRQIKQGALQELLNGKKCLPGFNGKWVTKLLGDMGAFTKGSGIKKDEAQTGDLPCIRYGEIYTVHNNCIREFHSWISKEVAEGAVRIRQGNILFAGSGETKEEIGKCVALVEDVEAYAGGDIVILRTTEGDPSFLGYYLNTASICKQKASMGQGDAVVHISSSALASIEVTVPESAEEQAAIGEILSDMDAEIFALEAKMAKARQIKQGMMQNLLTGRIRLT